TFSCAGIFTIACEWVRKAPSQEIAQGRKTRRSSATLKAISAVSSASCALSTHTSCQPRSRTASASLCSTPNAPGSSRARLPTIATIGMRSAGVTVSASNAYIQPTPLLPQNTRAPAAEACFTISNCECSDSATMYSQSSSPFDTSLATYCMTVSYGRIGYAVMTSTSASLQATAMASLPVMRETLSAAGCFGVLETIASAMDQPSCAIFNSPGTCSSYCPRKRKPWERSGLLAMVLTSQLWYAGLSLRHASHWLELSVNSVSLIMVTHFSTG